MERLLTRIVALILSLSLVTDSARAIALAKIPVRAFFQPAAIACPFEEQALEESGLSYLRTGAVHLQAWVDWVLVKKVAIIAVIPLLFQ